MEANSNGHLNVTQSATSFRKIPFSISEFYESIIFPVSIEHLRLYELTRNYSSLHLLCHLNNITLPGKRGDVSTHEHTRSDEVDAAAEEAIEPINGKNN